MFIKQSALHFLYLSRYANAYKYKHPIFAFIFLYVLKQKLIIQINTRTQMRVRIKITVGITERVAHDDISLDIGQTYYRQAIRAS